MTPPAVRAERLVRLLAQVPRPTLPISFRFDGIEATLSVRGLRADEVAEAIDAADDEPFEALRRGTIPAGVIARALLVDGRPSLTAVDVADLPEPEFAALRRAVSGALDTISPMYGRADVNAWRATLVEGLKHPSNHVIRRALGGAYDIAGGARARIIERPERFFGMPQREMTDGHWILYRAARALFETAFA